MNLDTVNVKKMNILALITDILIVLIAIEHIYILWIEMIAWETAGKRTFKTIPKDLFKPMKGLAANMGLYNGFLAAGLIWSFLIADPMWIMNVRLFFLGCVIVAGIFGAVTVSRKIFTIQAIPAIIAFIFVIISSAIF